jgi:hypothetical protein
VTAQSSGSDAISDATDETHILARAVRGPRHSSPDLDANLVKEARLECLAPYALM